ncbi:CAP domain-containing protein [Dactylonectria macrodidyma]|uniref:CAP domain-containing protein n=1 Tax=Dactylonectria macrodidyma TaxID=307937 RepID=A0A9P9EPF9_9HYPO|nr:CAP domain-containing protein [Dactylonectria macrodidyma]
MISLLYLPLLLATASFGAAEVVTTITVAATIPSNEPEWKQDKAFTSAILNSTNFYRSEHNATALTWNSTLEDFASDYLDDNDCEFAHSGGPYGENLAMGYANATASVEAWGDERDEYNFGRGKFSKKTGHFTQLVWKATTDVGCGRRLCGQSGWYLVCEYWPRGNVVGAFKEEVQEEEGEAVASRPRLGAVVAVVVVGSVMLWL